ncbi:MAG: hypothetical protein EBR46_09265, partial [Betaproteobacteria bacterium]|nr:hypothetical protein [Betaproteobacteria bacterium]
MRLGLGLDVGGTQCRWALADAQGQVVQEGLAGSFNGQQVHTKAGRDHIAQALAAVRQVVHTAAAAVAAGAAASGGQPAPVAAWAGVTGFDGHGGEVLQVHLARCLGLSPGALQL